MKEKVLFTSESVSKGHPDKVCDQISDAILDACLKEDPNSRVACEVFATTDLVVIGGEITTTAEVNYEQVARDVLKDIGYDDSDKGIDYRTCKVQVVMDLQSPDIALGTNDEVGGAGDQGIMFGYAMVAVGLCYNNLGQRVISEQQKKIGRASCRERV